MTEHQNTGGNAGQVEVRLFAAARAAIGAATVHLDPATLGALCDRLEQEHPPFAAVRPRCSFLVDGVAVHGDPYALPVRAGAQVDVLPPFAGG